MLVCNTKTMPDATKLVPIAIIETHKRLQTRGSTDVAKVRQYARAMKAGHSFPPVLLGRIGQKLYVVDGHHRLEAAHSARLREMNAVIRNFRKLDDAQLAALQCNVDHGKPMSSKEKQNAFASYLEQGLHLYTEDDFPNVAGTVKPLRVIHRDCPFYTFQHIGKKLRERGIDAPRGGIKAHYAARNEPTEEELAEDRELARSSFQSHLQALSVSFALLPEGERSQALSSLKATLVALQSPEPPKIAPTLEI